MQNIKSDVNFAELEKSMISCGLITEPSQDPEDVFNAELSKYARDLGITFDDPQSSGGGFSNIGKSETPRDFSNISRGVSNNVVNSVGNSMGNSMGNSVINNTISSTTIKPSFGESFKMPTMPLHNNDDDDDDNDDDNDDNDDNDDDDEDNSSYSQSYSQSQSYPQTSYRPPSSYNSSTYSGISHATELQRRTHEQERQSHISSVIDGIRGNEEPDSFSIEKEKEEDTKSQLLEQIDMLRITLEDEGADLSRIPEVNEHSTLAEIQNVHKIFRLKNDRNRYCSFAEEFIMFGAHALEDIFDGKRVWVGRYSPDLRGWHNTVNVKLRRMRYDTSNLVSGVMQDYNIGYGARILLELVPSMFLHSKMRKQQFGSQTLYSDDQMSAAMNDIRDFD